VPRTLDRFDTVHQDLSRALLAPLPVELRHDAGKANSVPQFEGPLADAVVGTRRLWCACLAGGLENVGEPGDMLDAVDGTVVAINRCLCL